jgi:hypothetical protein
VNNQERSEGEAMSEPRVEVDSYVVYPTGYDDMVHADKYTWCLEVTNGHSWGWSVRQAGYSSQRALNRKGEWIYESRGSGHNKARRWTAEEAIAIALKHVDTLTINGRTAAQASVYVASRLAASSGGVS